MVVKAKLIHGFIGILVGQVIAVLIWWIFDFNCFKGIFMGSLFAFLIIRYGNKNKV